MSGAPWFKFYPRDWFLDTRELTFKGGRSGEVIVPGDPDDSLLYELITLPADDDDVMPAEGKPLTKAETDLIRDWIKEGATWPDGVALDDPVAEAAAADPVATGKALAVSAAQDPQSTGQALTSSTLRNAESTSGAMRSSAKENPGATVDALGRGPAQDPVALEELGKFIPTELWVPENEPEIGPDPSGLAEWAKVGRQTRMTSAPSRISPRSQDMRLGLAAPSPKIPSYSTTPEYRNGSRAAEERFHKRTW